MTNTDDPGRSREVHPDDEQIAAYVDQTLSGDQRAALDTHLLRCADCRRLMADTAEFVHDQPASWRPRIVWVTGGLAAAAVLVLAVGLTSGPDTDGLVTAFANEPTRPAEGRVSGGFPYAPAPAPTRGADGRERSAEVEIAVAEIERDADDDQSAATQQILGIAHLANGEIDRAITQLEAAARGNGSDAALQSDLSAAYFARSRRTGASADAALALAAATRALELMPDSPEALFNRALILNALGRGEARAALQAVIDREPGSPWAAEASALLRSTP